MDALQDESGRWKPTWKFERRLHVRPMAALWSSVKQVFFKKNDIFLILFIWIEYYLLTQ